MEISLLMGLQNQSQAEVQQRGGASHFSNQAIAVIKAATRESWLARPQLLVFGCATRAAELVDTAVLAAAVVVADGALQFEVVHTVNPSSIPCWTSFRHEETVVLRYMVTD